VLQALPSRHPSPGAAHIRFDGHCAPALRMMARQTCRLWSAWPKKYQTQGLGSDGSLCKEGADRPRACPSISSNPAMWLINSTYAYWWIRQGIPGNSANSARTTAWPIHVSESSEDAGIITVSSPHRFGANPNADSTMANIAMGIEPKGPEDLNHPERSCASLDATPRGDEGTPHPGRTDSGSGQQRADGFNGSQPPGRST